MIHLRMRHGGPLNAPDFPLPCPWTLRAYAPGDEDAWVRIEQAADEHQPISRGTFEQWFGMGRAELPRRMLFLCDNNGREVGTATAWHDDVGHDPAKGRIHWVAIAPEAQGRGLARPLIAATCRRLAELGHTSAYLTTEDVRERATKLYLEFGFVPEVMGEEDRAAWVRLREQGLGVPSGTLL
jgi:GNAT superfamily N-acetyltransferase